MNLLFRAALAAAKFDGRPRGRCLALQVARLARPLKLGEARAIRDTAPGRLPVMPAGFHPTLEEVEARFRSLLDEAELPQPDGIHLDRAREEITFVWHDRKLVVTVGPDEEVHCVHNGQANGDPTAS